MSKIALLFPGQGSQELGMGGEVALKFLKQSDQILGYPLSALCQNGPLEELTLTYNAQPAILSCSIALYNVLMSQIELPIDYVAGHSLGEYSALVSAGAISFEDALKLVHLRGKYMAEAVPPGEGAMAAVIGLSREALTLAMQELDDASLVQAANYNSPEQIVISGAKEAVARLSELALEHGANRVVPLVVSGPFHSQLMMPAAHNFFNAAKKVDINIREDQPQVIANLTAKPYDSSSDVAQVLTDQLSSSVLWEDSMLFLLEQGVDLFIEIGSGRVLSSFMRIILKHYDKNATILSIRDEKSLHTVITKLQELNRIGCK